MYRAVVKNSTMKVCRILNLYIMAFDAVVVFGLWSIFYLFIFIYEHTVYVMSWLAKNYDIDSMEIVNYNVKIICLRCYTLQSTERDRIFRYLNRAFED